MKPSVPKKSSSGREKVVPGTEKSRPGTGRGRNRISGDFEKSSLGRLFSVQGRDEDGIGFSEIFKSRPWDDFFPSRDGTRTESDFRIF